MWLLLRHTASRWKNTRKGTGGLEQRMRRRSQCGCECFQRGGKVWRRPAVHRWTFLTQNQLKNCFKILSPIVHGGRLSTATRLAETKGFFSSLERAAWLAQTYRITSPAKIRPLSEQELPCALPVSSTVQVVSKIMIDQYPNSWKSKFLLFGNWERRAICHIP